MIDFKRRSKKEIKEFHLRRNDEVKRRLLKQMSNIIHLDAAHKGPQFLRSAICGAATNQFTRIAWEAVNTTCESCKRTKTYSIVRQWQIENACKTCGHPNCSRDHYRDQITITGQVSMGEHIAI